MNVWCAALGCAVLCAVVSTVLACLSNLSLCVVYKCRFLMCFVVVAVPSSEEIQALCEIAETTACLEDCHKGCGVCGALCNSDNTTIIALFVPLVFERVRSSFLLTHPFISSSESTGIKLKALPESFASLRNLTDLYAAYLSKHIVSRELQARSLFC